MKIIFLNHFITGGGAERVVSLLSKKMIEKGHRVCLVTDVSVPFAYQFDPKVYIYPLFRNEHE